MGTDGWMEHGPTAAGANNLEVARAGVATIQQHKRTDSESEEQKDHLFLSFTFVPIVSLSFWQKAIALSMPFKKLLHLESQEPGGIFIINLLEYPVG